MLMKITAKITKNDKKWCENIFNNDDGCLIMVFDLFAPYRSLFPWVTIAIFEASVCQ